MNKPHERTSSRMAAAAAAPEAARTARAHPRGRARGIPPPSRERTEAPAPRRADAPPPSSHPPLTGSLPPARLPAAPSATQAWYFIDKAVEGVLRDCLRDLLENPPIPLKYMGLSKLTLETLTLGGAPPTCGGVKVVNTEKEEVVVDVEAKLAGGEPNILLVAHTITGQRRADAHARTPWGPLLSPRPRRPSRPDSGPPPARRIPLQLAELQVFTTVRLGFTPLLPTFPCFGAVTISVMARARIPSSPLPALAPQRFAALRRAEPRRREAFGGPAESSSAPTVIPALRRASPSLTSPSKSWLATS